MGIAVEDDSMSDDDLVDRLERVRRTNDPPERVRNVPPLASLSNAQISNSRGDGKASSSTPSLPLSPSLSDKPTQSFDIPLSTSLVLKDSDSDSEDTEVWQAARKAFLCIREIVRTEKKYQEALKMLLNAQVCLPPPTQLQADDSN